MRIALYILLAAVVVAGITWALTHSRNPSSSSSNITRVSDYASHSGAWVRFTILGPVVANEKYASSTITVSPTSRNVTVYQTYLNQAQYTQNYDNNQSAFTQFMDALQIYGFSRQRPSAQSEVGSTCPFGLRYIYDLYDGSTHVFSSWTSTCTTTTRTFNGNVQSVNSLFQRQIPNLGQISQYQALVGM